MRSDILKCKYCVNFERLATNNGFCRRHAPRPLPVDVEEAKRDIENDTTHVLKNFIWPVVSTGDYCGEGRFDSGNAEDGEPSNGSE